MAQEHNLNLVATLDVSDVESKLQKLQGNANKIKIDVDLGEAKKLNDVKKVKLETDVSEAEKKIERTMNRMKNVVITPVVDSASVVKQLTNHFNNLGLNLKPLIDEEKTRIELQRVLEEQRITITPEMDGTAIRKTLESFNKNPIQLNVETFLNEKGIERFKKESLEREDVLIQIIPSISSKHIEGVKQLIDKMFGDVQIPIGSKLLGNKELQSISVFEKNEEGVFVDTGKTTKIEVQKFDAVTPDAGRTKKQLVDLEGNVLDTAEKIRNAIDKATEQISLNTKDFRKEDVAAVEEYGESLKRKNQSKPKTVMQPSELVFEEGASVESKIEQLQKWRKNWNEWIDNQRKTFFGEGSENLGIDKRQKNFDIRNLQNEIQKKYVEEMGKLLGTDLTTGKPFEQQKPEPPKPIEQPKTENAFDEGKIREKLTNRLNQSINQMTEEFAEGRQSASDFAAGLKKLDPRRFVEMRVEISKLAESFKQGRISQDEFVSRSKEIRMRYRSIEPYRPNMGTGMGLWMGGMYLAQLGQQFGTDVSQNPIRGGMGLVAQGLGAGVSSASYLQQMLPMISPNISKGAVVGIAGAAAVAETVQKIGTSLDNLNQSLLDAASKLRETSNKMLSNASLKDYQRGMGQYREKLMKDFSDESISKAEEKTRRAESALNVRRKIDAAQRNELAAETANLENLETNQKERSESVVRWFNPKFWGGLVDVKNQAVAVAELQKTVDETQTKLQASESELDAWKQSLERMKEANVQMKRKIDESASEIERPVFLRNLDDQGLAKEANFQDELKKETDRQILELAKLPSNGENLKKIENLEYARSKQRRDLDFAKREISNRREYKLESSALFDSAQMEKYRNSLIKGSANQLNRSTNLVDFENDLTDARKQFLQTRQEYSDLLSRRDTSESGMEKLRERKTDLDLIERKFRELGNLKTESLQSFLNVQKPELTQANSLASIGYMVDAKQDREDLKAQSDFMREQTTIQRQIRDHLKTMDVSSEFS